MKFLNLALYVMFFLIMNVLSFAQDALEPNDTKETAYDVTSELANANGDLTISSLSVTANNPDFYKLVVSERSTLHVNFLFSPGNGAYDLDAYIYNSSMNEIAAGESGTPNEDMEIGDLAAGTYYIKIYGWGGATNSYAMHITRTAFSSDDSYEPNDTKATATNLTSAVIAANGQLTLSNLAIVAGNQDWFKLTLSATSTINTTVTFTHANGNLDAQIFDASDNSLALGNSTTNNESLSTATLSPGTYYLKIFGATATVANTYSLFLESNNYIQDDTYEPNDTKSAATNLTADFVNSACYKSGLRINTGNEDWFKVVLTQAGTLNVVVVFTPGGGDRDLDSYIYNESNTLLSSGESGSPNEVMSTGSVSAGTYYIRIYGYNGANNNYDLDLSFQASGNQAPVALSQTVSVNEDNSLAITLTGTDPENNTLTYSIVTQPSHGTLSGSNANRVYTPSLNYFGADSFTFKVNDGLLDSQEATISITLNAVNDAPSIQNLLVACIKSGGNHFMVNANDVENDFLTYSIITNPEHGVITSTGTPGYYIYTPSGVLLDDVMTIKVNDGNLDSSVATVNFRVDDRFEENDTSATAYDLTAEVNAAYGHFDEKNMLILSGDEDWFKLVVTERSELDLNLIFSPGNGLFDLDVYVYNGNLDEIANSESGNDNEAISIGDLPAGTYYIQVLGWSGAANDYETQIELRPYSPDDIYEENDSKVSAYNLTNKLVLANGQLEIDNLNLLNNDPDWYKVTTTASSSVIKWQINFSNVVGNLDMAVYDENETLLQSSVSNSNSEIITLSGLSAGNYYVKIYGADGVVNDYNLQMEVSSFIVDDSFEENDTKTQASDITNNFVGNNLFINNLKIISNDDDWFKFTTNTTANISAIVVFSPGGGLYDLDAYLEKTDGTRLATGESGNDNEVLNANNLPAGTYYIRVTGWAGAHNNYGLQINLVTSNTAPIANADAVTTNEDAIISFNPVTNDTDVNGDVLNITAITNGTKGNATFSGNIITYTPNLNNNGSDPITYTISDGHGGFATGTVTITITPVNDAPIANADYITTSEDTVISFNPETNDTDVDGDILSLTSVSNGTKGSANRIGNIVTYTPNLNANGSDTLSYTIIDGNGGTSNGTIHITITPVNDAPVAVTDILNATTENNGGVFTSIPALFDVLANDTDAENNTLTITSVTAPLHGTASIQSNKILYTTNTGYSGPDSFTYTISDGQASSSVAVSITVSISYIYTSPIVENVTIPSSQTSYTLDEVIDIMVQFDTAVTVTGLPQLALNFSNGVKQAVYTSGSNTDQIHFAYTVQAGDNASPLNYVDVNSLALNGGTMTNAYSGSVNADLALPLTTSPESLLSENVTVSANVPMVSFSIPGGQYNNFKNVSCTPQNISGGTIKVYYTIDGSTPTTASPFVDSSTNYKVLINATKTLKAFVSNGTVSSGIATAQYTISKPQLTRKASLIINNLPQYAANLPCYHQANFGLPISYYDLGTGEDRFDLNPSLTRMNIVTFEISDIFEPGTLKLDKNSVSAGTATAAIGQTIQLVVDISSDLNSKTFSAYIDDADNSLENKEELLLTIDRGNNYTEEGGFLPNLTGTANCSEFSTSTFILNASGSASPIEGSEDQFEFLHTLIPAGESAQKIFDRPMGGSWNYTQGVYAFGEVAFPSTSFTFIRHAFDLAGNRKLQLNVYYDRPATVPPVSASVTYNRTLEGYTISISSTGVCGDQPSNGDLPIATPSQFYASYMDIVTGTENTISNLGGGCTKDGSFLLIESTGHYSIFGFIQYQVQPCFSFKPFPPEEPGLKSIKSAGCIVSVSFENLDDDFDQDKVVKVFTANDISLDGYPTAIKTVIDNSVSFNLQYLANIPTSVTASVTAVEPNFNIWELQSSSKTESIISGKISKLNFAKCGISFTYEKTNTNEISEITISLPSSIQLDMSNYIGSYKQSNNVTRLFVKKGGGDLNFGFNFINSIALKPTDKVFVSISTPGCNNNAVAEYNEEGCSCQTENPTPKLKCHPSQNSTTNVNPPANHSMVGGGNAPIGDANKPVESVVADQYGRTTSVVYADGGILTYVYDDVNQTITETNEDGTNIRYYYDSTFVTVQQKVILGGAKGYNYEYNVYGDVTRIATLQNNVEIYAKTFEYDSARNITKKTENDGTFETWSYGAGVTTHTDKFGNISTKNFDSEKRIILTTDVTGSVAYVYDLMGGTANVGLVYTVYRNPENVVTKVISKIYSALGVLQATEYRLTENLGEIPYYKETYNAEGETILVTYLREGVAQNMPPTNYIYNGAGRVISATAPDGGVTTYQYSSTPGQEDLMTIETDVFDNKIYHEYDSMRREIKTYGNTTRPGVTTYTNAGHILTFECKQFNPLTQTYGPTHYKEIYTYMGTLLLTKTIQNANGTASIVESNTYDGLGRRATHTDANGIVTKYSYNSMDNLTEEIRDFGISPNNLNITTNYTYNAKGQLEDTSFEGKTTRNIYDSFGRLTSVVQDPLGLNITQVSYTYDSQWRQKTMTDAMGNVTTYNYNQLGQQYQTVNALGVVSESHFDGAGNVIRRIEDAGAGKLNATTEFFFDNQGRQFKTVSAVGQTYQREDRVEFDLNGNVIKQIEDYGVGKLNRTTVFEFDSLGNQTKTTLDPDATGYTGLKITNESTYNEIGQMTSTIAPNGLVTQYNYNYLGRQTSTVIDPSGQAITSSVIYDNNGNTTQSTDAGGLIITVVYDALSRQGTQTVDPSGKNIVAKTFYNRDGSVDKTINPEGVVTKNIYNSLGQRTSTIVDQGVTNITTQFEYNLVGNITTVIDPLTKTATRGYDALHRSIASTDAKGNISRVVYDNLNRPVTSIDALGVQTVTSYNLLNQVTSQTVDPTGLNQTSSLEYDSLGRTTKVIKANNIQEVFEYDLADRKTKSIEDPTGLNIITQYEYNNLSQMTKVIDAKNKATQYGYNYLGRLETETYADAGVKSYTYNAIGQRITQTDQNNNQFGYLYDNLYRLTTVNVTPGVGVGGTTQQVFEYDNLSRLTNAKDITLSYTNEVIRDYNTLGRLEFETQKIGTTTIKTIAKEYNLVDRVSKLTYPNGRINDYTFDNNHLPSTIVSNSTIVATYTFNSVNAPTTKTLGNTVSLNIEYNNRYQITKHDWKKNGITISGYNYGQDNVGNRIWSENLVNSNKSELFAFDNADRLTSFKTGTLNGSKTAITSQIYSQGWTLDSIGNWAGFNDNGSNSTNVFSDTHEMTQFKGIINTFDNNGNLIFDGVRSFKYDAFNRIIEVKVGSVSLAEYQYDAFNRRVVKKVDGDLNSSFETTIKFLYDGFRCIEELNASDVLVKDYVYGSLYIDEVILQRTGATDYYFTHDYRYSVTSLTNSAGNIVESYDYKVYGERTITGSGLIDIGYTGQRHDSETGLMYFKNRYYSASMGSFVTRDPLGYVDGMSSYLGYFGGGGIDWNGLEEVKKYYHWLLKGHKESQIEDENELKKHEEEAEKLVLKGITLSKLFIDEGTRITEKIKSRKALIDEETALENKWNSLDTEIKTITDEYNKKYLAIYGIKCKDITDLSPNLVKAILFKETKIGTDVKFKSHIDDFNKLIKDSKKLPNWAYQWNVGRVTDGNLFNEIVKDFNILYTNTDLLKGGSSNDIRLIIGAIFKKLDYGAGVKLRGKNSSVKKTDSYWYTAIQLYNGSGSIARTYADEVFALYTKGTHPEDATINLYTGIKTPKKKGK